MTLVEFLLARLAEDEAMWLAMPSAARLVLKIEVFDGARDQWSVTPNGHATITRTRVLAEVEAKRRIISEHAVNTYTNMSGPNDFEDTYCTRCSAFDFSDSHPGCPTLKQLAMPYADHPDFDPNWKPEDET